MSHDFLAIFFMIVGNMAVFIRRKLKKPTKPRPRVCSLPLYVCGLMSFDIALIVSAVVRDKV